MDNIATGVRTDGYIDSYYTRSSKALPPLAPLKTTIEADVCVVGGGIAGLSAAWELTLRGLSVVLVEARRVGWGASGRNGGLLSSGFAASTESIQARSGSKDARALHDLSCEGIDIVLENTQKLNLRGVDPVPGVISASRHPDAAGMQAWQRFANEQLGAELCYLTPDDMRDLVRSKRYFDGIYDPNAWHIHPLNYCIGMADNILRKGGQIFENTAMTSMQLSGAEKIICTQTGTVRCEHVVLCGSGYAGSEFGRLRRCLLPIATYAVSTRGLGARADEIMASPAAVVDTRLTCDYFRVTPTGELLWGGGMSGLAREPANLSELMHQRIVEVFPQVADVEIEVSWTGLMGYARHKMPYLQEMKANVWAATALGGHGLNTGPALGRLLAEAITRDSKRYQLFAPYKLQWNGSFAGPVVADAICAASNFAHRRKENNL